MTDYQLLGQGWAVGTWGTWGSPALILLHGFTGSHASWNALATRWAQTFFVLAPDLPGHGATLAPPNPQELSLAASADRLAVLLDQLSIAQAAVVGYSLGGRLALHFALRHGRRLSRLVLESASPGLADQRERQERRDRDNALATRIEQQGLEWFVPYWAQQPLFRNQPAWLVDEENRIRRSHSANGLAQSLRGAGTGVQDSLWNALGQISCPVLLITGSHDPKFCAIAETMAPLMRHARRVVVDGAGHTVHGEKPETFYEQVSHFLTKAL